MEKYRKKPESIVAEQWFPDKEIEGVQMDSEWNICTLVKGKKVFVKPCDWIIKSENEIIDVCKNETFKKTYEKVE